MLLISHRGNTTGPSDKENHPDYLKETSKKYFIEVDIWYKDNAYYLGHDGPEYKVNKSFLSDISDVSYFHAKNLEALYSLSTSGYSCFYHNNDDYTLTSNLFIWTYPEKDITHRSIIVCQSLEQSKKYAKSVAYGICSDYVNLIGSTPF